MGAKHPGALRKFIIACSYEASVPHGTQVFCGVEAEGGEVAERTGGDSAPCCAECLSGILNEQELILLLERGEGVPIGTLSVEVYRHDSSDILIAGRPKNSLDGLRRKIEAAGIYVGQKGFGA